MIRIKPGSVPRNGLPPSNYAYRGTGTDTLTAFMDDEPDEPEPRRPGPPASHPCGTPAAYRRHLRRGEQPCDPCQIANRVDTAQRKASTA